MLLQLDDSLVCLLVQKNNTNQIGVNKIVNGKINYVLLDILRDQQRLVVVG